MTCTAEPEGVTHYNGFKHADVQEADPNVFDTRCVAQRQISYAGSNNTPLGAYPEVFDFGGQAYNAPPGNCLQCHLPFMMSL